MTMQLFALLLALASVAISARAVLLTRAQVRIAHNNLLWSELRSGRWEAAAS